jgi:sodium-dependent dicarboxylate transporter 2/3/5
LPGDSFSVCLLLGIAYAASIGGVATLIGTPPNAFMAGFLHKQGIEIGFGQWMLVGVPLAGGFLVIAWLVLTRWVYPVRQTRIDGGRRLIRYALDALGPVLRGEWIVLGVFLATALLWIVRQPLTKWTWLTGHVPPLANLNDAIIAMAAALVLFAVPVHPRRGVFALDWDSARRLPWGVLLLFGGGLSLAKGAQTAGLTEWIGGLVAGLEGLPTLALVAVVVVIVLLLTEVTSNLATTAALLPILYGVAVGLKIDPITVVAPATLAASCAFMLPVATPPNAIVFGSQQVSIAQMVRAGCWLNLAGLVVILAVMYTLGGWVLGVRF